MSQEPDDLTADGLRSKYPPIYIEELPTPSLNYDTNGPRLMIQRIENINFKSYGGKRILGPFHKNFNCIIGPNGSGKSNAIDSLLFVFGFKASKIRSKKLSVLIHKSEFFPDVQSCTVAVYFQTIVPKDGDDNEYDIIENSQFVVSRTAYKDNTSIIKINDKKYSTKDAADYLKKKGIDLDHNRFLILQGEVEQIALMKPKALNEYEDGLLEYLEDIIGSNRFKKPLEELFKRLDELCELRTDKLNRVKIVEKEKKELEGIRNAAVKYLMLCNEIVIRKNITFQLKRYEYHELFKTTEEHISNINEKIEKVNNEVEEINESRSDKQKIISELVKDSMMKNQEYLEHKENFKKLEFKDNELQEKRRSLAEYLENLEQQMREENKKMQMYCDVPKESEHRMKDLEKEINNLDALKKKEEQLLITEQERLSDETKDLTKEMEKTKNEILSESNHLDKQKNEISTLKCDLEMLQKNYQREQDKFTKNNENLKVVLNKLKEANEKYQQLNETLPKLKSDYEDSSQQLYGFKQKNHQLRQQMNKLNNQLNECKSSRNDNSTLSFLLEQQNCGKIKGVVGRLGDLASIDSKYDVAISTACGRLDNIVCETMDDAQRCVELMKRHNVSRTAFIAMDKVARYESYSDKSFTSPHSSHRLFDLLQLDDPRYRAVFYFALRDILVVNTVNDGRKINSNRSELFRIVSLKGELIETTGAMTGGGNIVIRGKLRLNDNPNKSHNSSMHAQHQPGNYQQLEAEYRQCEQQISELSTEYNNLEMRCDEMKRQIEEQQSQYNYYKNQLQSLNTEKNNLNLEEKDCQQKLEKLKPDHNKVAGIEKTITQLTKAYDKDSKKIQLLKEKSDNIEEEINKITIAKLGCIETRVRSIAEKLNEKQKTLKKITQGVKKAEKIVSDLTESMNSNMKLKEEKTKEHKRVNEEFNIIVEKARVTLCSYQTAEKEYNILVKEKEAKEKEMSESTQKLKDLNQLKTQFHRNKKEEEEKLHNYKHRIRKQDEIINELKLYPIPDECRDEQLNFMDLIPGSSNIKLDTIFSSMKESYANSSCTKLKNYSEDDLESLKVQTINFQDLEDELNRQKPNLAAIEQYRIQEELYMSRVGELNVVTEIRDTQRVEMERLKNQRLSEFSAGFNLITGKLKEMYQMITIGGDAELELVDTLNPFSDGIVFSVRPPKKSWKNISNLSGGEKTLSSLALVFALHHYKPTPFYFMDEIDAALDFKNVSIVANYIKDRTKNAQFIIISLRNNMYELSDYLVCVYKPFNFSKTATLDSKKCKELFAKKKLQFNENVPAEIAFK